MIYRSSYFLDLSSLIFGCVEFRIYMLLFYFPSISEPAANKKDRYTANIYILTTTNHSYFLQSQKILLEGTPCIPKQLSEVQSNTFSYTTFSCCLDIFLIQHIYLYIYSFPFQVRQPSIDQNKKNNKGVASFLPF